MGEVFLMIESQSAHPVLLVRKHVHVHVLYGFVEVEACTDLAISNLQIALGVYSSQEQHRRQGCRGHRKELGQEQVLDTPRYFIERLWRLWGYWHGQGHRLEFKPFVRRLEPEQVGLIHLKTYSTFERTTPLSQASILYFVRGTVMEIADISVESDSQPRVLGTCLSRARPDR